MKHHQFGLPAAAITLALILNANAATTIDFDSFDVGADGVWNGLDGSITLSGATFANSPNSGYPDGFSVSNHTDTTTAGFSNQFSAYTGSGAAGSTQYAIWNQPFSGSGGSISFNSTTDLTGRGAMFTNTTYAALDMLNGSGFSKKFGGVSGNDADWFLLTIEGFASGSSTGTVPFYLADYRYADNASDFIVDEWAYVDFSKLGSVDEIRFSLSSSDTGDFGMNTPAYFAMDNLVIPEPSTLLCSLAGLGLILRRKR